MKFLLSLLFTISFLSLQAQTQNEPKPLPDFDSIDLSAELGKMFNMMDSLPLDLGDFGNMNDLFKQHFGDISEDKELFSDLLGQSMKMMENIDMEQMQGLMNNLMKDFEGLNLEELLDTEEMDKIVKKHAERKKI